MESVLKSLPLGKAVGPDRINNRILRGLAHELSNPLCSLINQSLRIGIYPDSWKDTHICPIFKGGDSASVSNYKPISLLSCLDKVSERAVFKHLYMTITSLHRSNPDLYLVTQLPTNLLYSITHSAKL